jgi:hypothetical protein
MDRPLRFTGIPGGRRISFPTQNFRRHYGNSLPTRLRQNWPRRKLRGAQKRTSNPSQPPLYYALASVWWRIGQHIGLTGIQSLYWIRFLNVPLIAIVVWLDYVTARTLAPERVDLRIGIFYAINNDVLSPICFGALFLCLLPWLRAKTPGFSLGALSGLGIAATYLTKLSNLPLVTVALVAIIARLVSLMRQRPSAGLMASTALILCSAIPVVSWMIWTKYQFGDLAGSTTKIACLVRHENRSRTGCIIQYLRREVFGCFGRNSLPISGAARSDGTLAR